MQFSIYEEEKSDFQNKIKEIKMPATTFGILRKQLLKNVGQERAYNLLFSLGCEMGIHDAKQLLQQGMSIEELVKQGPLMHIENGQIEGIIHQCEGQFDEKGKLISLVGQGTWIGSYEAQEHLKWIGPANRPICSTLAGYSSGYMSEVFNERLIAKELTCAAKGDSNCTWIIKTQRQWEMESQNQEYISNPMTIEMELQYTYDQLLEQRNFIKKLSDFQHVLSNELLQGKNLADLCQDASKIIGIPICIKDREYRTITYAGLMEKEYYFLNDEFDDYIQNTSFYSRKSEHPINFNKIQQIETERQIRYIAPIVVKGQLLAWCYFIYDKKRRMPKEDEILFLERFVNTASIILLNERTQFESFERMKGNFLEQLLSKALTEQEMIKRGLFAGINFNKPYYIVTSECIMNHSNTDEKFEIQEQLLEFSFNYFHEQQIHALIGHRDGRITFLISEIKNDKQLVLKLEHFQEKLEKAYPHVKIQFGVSSSTQSPMSAGGAFKEATMALRLTFTKDIVFYEDLGIISLLVNDKELEWVKSLAEKDLKGLKDFENMKSIELLKTLYVFLINGGNLEKTRSSLNLSLSGLRHRIQNIEEQLGKDIRNPEIMYHLLLVLKLLIITGELNLKMI
ncbi:helix-turn-helix domain-containing protein [Ureibacillus composti]